MLNSQVAPATTVARDSRTTGFARIAQHHKSILALVLLIGLLLRLPTFAAPVLSDDEAIYATTANAMVRGDALYRDVVDHKPPAIYDIYLVGFLALGPYQTHGAHALVVLAALGCAFGLARIARRLYRDEQAGVVAALLWAVFSTAGLRYDTLAANCELFLVAAQAAALYWLVRQGDYAVRSWRAWFGIGVLTGAATVFKYQGATFLAVVALAAFLEWHQRRRTTWSALAAMVVAGVGWLTVPGLYAIRLWHAGALPAAWEWFRFNFAYVQEGRSGIEALQWGAMRVGLFAGLALVPYAFGIRGVWLTTHEWIRGDGARRAGAGAGFESRALALTWLASSCIALAAGGRFFGHYFHHVLPALCLLASGPFLWTWRNRAPWRPVMAALIAVPAVAFLGLATIGSAWVVGLTDPEPTYDALVSRLDAASRPEDRVFVWGNSPQVYVLAQRPMGTRFSFCNYMTGISPGTRTETGQADPTPNIVWRSWDLLFVDLEQRRPRWIVDAASAGWDGYAAYPISRYPAFDEYVRGHYVERERVDGVRLLERSDR